MTEIDNDVKRKEALEEELQNLLRLKEKIIESNKHLNKMHMRVFGKEGIEIDEAKIQKKLEKKKKRKSGEEVKKGKQKVE